MSIFFIRKNVSFMIEQLDLQILESPNIIYRYIGWRKIRISGDVHSWKIFICSSWPDKCPDKIVRKGIKGCFNSARYRNCGQRHTESCILCYSKNRGSTAQIVTINDVISKIAGDETMKQQWDNYRKTNYYVGTLEWDDVIGSTRILRAMIK